MAAVSAPAPNTSFLDDEKKDMYEEVENVNEKNVGLSEAIHAEEQEHMGVLAAFKLYPKATFWSFCVSFVIVSIIPSSARVIIIKVIVLTI